MPGNFHVPRLCHHETFWIFKLSWLGDRVFEDAWNSAEWRDYVPDRQKRRLNQHQMAPIDTPTWSVIFSLLSFLGPLLNLASFEPETANHWLFEKKKKDVVTWVISSFNRWTIANALCLHYWFSVIPFVWNSSVLPTVECRTTSPMGNRWQALLNPSPPPFPFQLSPSLWNFYPFFCLPLFLILLVKEK